MPCDIRISKMILYSIILGAQHPIIDIAGILMCPRQFFLHEEKRSNIEFFMHFMVDYDRGRYNDFLLRRELFADWKSTFYLQYRNAQLKKKKEGKKKKKNYREKKEYEEVYEKTEEEE